MNMHDAVTEFLDDLTVIRARGVGMTGIEQEPYLSPVASQKATISSAFSTSIIK